MIYYITMIFSVVFFIAIIQLIRRDKLGQKYWFFWITVSVMILLATIFYSASDIFNITSIFLASTTLLVIYILHLFIVTTKQNKCIITLGQELAMLKNSVNNIRKSEKI
jgi:FtsH-binding integral membrane protein